MFWDTDTKINQVSIVHEVKSYAIIVFIVLTVLAALLYLLLKYAKSQMRRN